MKSRFIKRRAGPTALLADFAAVWNELFPAEQARVVQLLVERTDVHEDAFELEVQGDEPEALHTAALQTADGITSGDPVTVGLSAIVGTRTRHPASNGRSIRWSRLALARPVNPRFLTER